SRRAHHDVPLARLAARQPRSAQSSSAHHTILELANFGLTEADLDRVFTASGLIGMKPCTLREILQRLRDTYSGTVAVQYAHIQDSEVREWLQSQIEPNSSKE